MVDSIIVGKFLGTQPFAAVGMTGSITFFVLGLVFGACSGFAIPVAQDFGAHNEAGVRRCVANIIHIGVIFGLVMTLATTLLTRQILVWMDTPEELMQDAYDYLFWIFLGIGSLMLYNLLAGILRSLGDSTTPLIFLILSSLLNIGLDVLLVWTLNVGVKGAAIATVIAQLISGLGCLVFMIRKFPMLRLTRKDLRPDLPTIRRLSGIGFPMGLQFSITAIGSIILQKSVNALGTTIITSGYSRLSQRGGVAVGVPITTPMSSARAWSTTLWKKEKSNSPGAGSMRCQANSPMRTTLMPISFMRAKSRSISSSGQSSG